MTNNISMSFANNIPVEENNMISNLSYLVNGKVRSNGFDHRINLVVFVSIL